MNKFLLVLPLLLSTFFSNPCSAADTKADQANKLLSESFEQSNIWAHGPVQVAGKFKILRANQPELNLETTAYWSGPDKWRVEWSGAGYEETEVASGGKVYIKRSSPLPAIQVMLLQIALGIALGNNPNGAFFSPVPSQSPKVEVSKEKIGGVSTECLHPANLHGTACVDPSQHHVLRYQDEKFIFDFSNYVTLEGASYPGAVEVSIRGGRVLLDGQLSVTRPAAFNDSLFQPLTTGEVSNYATCPDLQNAITAPKLDNRIMPRYPAEAMRNRQQGTVYIYADVGADGSIKKAEVLTGPSPQFNDSALTAVRQWKYTPYLRCGTAAGFESLVTVNYVLP